MDSVFISQYDLEIPSVKLAREVFTLGLGLKEVKMKDNDKMVSFEIGGALLYCRVLPEEQKIK